jgi:hypothetical protein
MSRIAVYSIQSLDELSSALKQFRDEILEILQSVEWEIIRTEQFLSDEISHWRYQEEVCKEEVLEAEKALECCRDDDCDCSEEEEALFQAERSLRQTQDELQDNRRKLRVLDEVAEDYRRQARRLKTLVENDLKQGDLSLESAITKLYEYVEMRKSLGAIVGNNGVGLESETKTSKFSSVEKNLIIENLPEPEGLPYSDKMRKCLLDLCHLDNDDFLVMSEYLKSREHKPAIFDNQAMAETIFKRDFSSHAEVEGGWSKEWLGITAYYTDSSSLAFGIPMLPHRIIIAKYSEDVLMHELGHQLHRLVWTETGQAGESKRIKVKELYANVEAGRIRPLNRYIDSEGEYFAYSFEWFFQRPEDLRSRDPAMFEFLNTQVLNGMYYENL